MNKNNSLFILGPRGTGKSTWIREEFPDAFIIDLLDLAVYGELLRDPHRLESMIPSDHRGAIAIDEVQRLPQLLNEVHRLIETKKMRFILTGSSARKLRREGTNLLAGRARTIHMHPLTAYELGPAFRFKHSLQFGQLPSAYVDQDPGHYLLSYVGTYLREEVQAEALVRNLETFSRFITAASFSQAGVLEISAIAQELGIARKTVDGYLSLLEDLLISIRLPVFSKRAKRAMAMHPKFYFFDAGVFRTLRPKGPLDSFEEIDGAALETLALQELRATNDNAQLGYDICYWRTRDQKEIDFILYGERGLWAFEIKRSAFFRESDLSALRLFQADYPKAHCQLWYTGDETRHIGGIDVVPIVEVLPKLHEFL